MNPESDPKNTPQPDTDPLVFKYDFEPSEFKLREPSIDDLEHWLATHLAVLVGRDLVEHLMDCVRHGKTLDTAPLAEAASTSTISLEVRRWFSCEEEGVIEDRAIVITRPLDPPVPFGREEERDTLEADQRDSPARELLALHLFSPAPNKLEALLTFKDEALSITANQVNQRWRIFNELVVAQGYPALGFDLAENARGENFNLKEPIFMCGMIDIAAYPVPSEVSLTYDETEGKETSSRQSIRSRLEDPFGTTTTSNAASAEEDQDDDIPEGHAPPQPTEPLTLRNPNPEALSIISTLSGLALSPTCLDELLQHARGIKLLDGKFVAELLTGLKNVLSLQTRTRHVLNGSYEQRSSVAIENSPELDQGTFALELRPMTINSEGVATTVEARINWQDQDPTATQNWGEILRAAGFKGPG